MLLKAILIIFSALPLLASAAISLPNPLGTATTIPDLINRILDFLILIATPLAAIMVMVGAYQMLFAAGDPEKFSKGKQTIIYVVIGYAILWIGSGIIGVIESVLKGDF